ncbi:MAG: holo-ACP synthase [Candidatus Hinthialibacter antarcticus]|nr:holo-ACP synthase [Candidatus Hinthialibacter antarcticus]
MSIIGLGMDLIQISRIEQTLIRHGERFTRRVFHDYEVRLANTRKKNAEYLAGCFAVKEAALKAFGDFPGRGIPWSEIFITHERTGKPVLHFEGRAKALADEKGANRYHVTITHDGDVAAAVVILED